MRVVEKFVSINGEGLRSGELAVFIRFANCNLRCSYCDTKYSFISSSLIKEVLAFDADVRNLVPEQVLIALKNKSKGRE